jgi:hypothetical protein
MAAASLQAIGHIHF